jgi:hypothetical protein
MNIPSLTPRDIIEVVLKRTWWILAGLPRCTIQAYKGREYSLKSIKSTGIVAKIDSKIFGKESSFYRNLVVLRLFAEWK